MTVGLALKIGRLPALATTVQAFRGSEKLSELFKFRIRFETPIPGPVLQRIALGSSATLYLRSAGHDRQVHGLICAIRDEADVTVATGHAVFSVDLVPHAWLLTRRVGSRIYQDLSIPQVIDDLLARYELPKRWVLERTRPARVYTTQYEESDWAAVKRLAAENGVLFYFVHELVLPEPDVELQLAGEQAAIEARAALDVGMLLAQLESLAHREPREQLVFTDYPTYPPIHGSMISLHAAGTGAAPEDHVYELRERRRIRPTAAVFREFDWRRPPFPIESEHQPDPEHDRPNEPHDLEIYEHHLRDHEPDLPDTTHEAPRMLASARADAATFAGRSSSVRLLPGAQFLLEGEEWRLALTQVRHRGARRGEGNVSVSYENQFEAVPAQVAVIPRRPPRRNAQACLTAVVAGPPDEEIHTNEHGQIKVKFIWDRRPDKSDPSCWLRCMQTWAGTGWGFQFIPRVGMEVIVGFEGGDPDRPIVMGCVYNNVQPEPFMLPGGKTRSGIRTRSTPRSLGFNELSFEDKVHEEQVYMHAQRDFDAIIERDRTANISRDDHVSVAGAQTIGVGGASSLSVGGDRTVSTRGEVEDTTHGLHIDTRMKTCVLDVREDYAVLVDQQASLNSDSTRVATQRLDVDAGPTTLHVGNEEPADLTMVVKGSSTWSTKQNVSISSEDGSIMLSRGHSLLHITENQIEIVSPTIVLRGKNAQVKLEDGECKVYVTSNFQVVSEGEIKLRAEGSSLGMRRQVQVAGTQILLNSPTQASDHFEIVDPTRTNLVLTDSEGHPVPNAIFIVHFQNGAVTAGVTGPDGSATVEGEGEGEVQFPGHLSPERQ